MLENKDVLINSRPATRWVDATPTGNGHIGAMVYGKLTRETILINDENWYHMGGVKKIPHMKNRLEKLRAMIDRGDYRKADGYFPNVVKSKFIKPPSALINTARSYLCGVDLIIEDDCKSAFSQYSRTLDMNSGVASIKWLDGNVQRKRETFVSRADNVVVCRISGSENLNLHLFFERHNPLEPGQERSNIFNRYAIKTDYQKNVGCAFCQSENVHFGTVMRVISDGKVAADNNGITVYDTKEVLILVGTWWKGKDAAPTFDKATGALGGRGLSYQQLLDRSKKLHADLYSRVTFTLNASTAPDTPNEALLLKSYSGEVDPLLIEKMFRYGRYLLICASPETGLPANLQGVWNGDYLPAWSCVFFNNENIQLCYYAAMQGGTPELMLPFFDLYERLLPDFKENAQRIFGAEGILLPLYNNAYSGFSNDLQPHCIYWTGGGAWIAEFFYDYFQYTGDKEFLKNRALPFMEAVLDFYRSFCGQDNGMLKFYPSISPENTSNGTYVSINATMDIALFRELCLNLYNAYSILGSSSNKLEDIRSLLEKTPSYRINSDGAIAEWVDGRFPDNYKHRHLSHLYPVFPSTEMNAVETPDLFEACKKAVEKRLVVGLKDQCGWSLSHSANVYARLGMGDEALNSLSLVARVLTGENLLTHINDWHWLGISELDGCKERAPFQLDANCGFSAAVIEMLVFSKPNLVSILPALPASWTQGSINGVRLRGGGEISVKWDLSRQLVEVDLSLTNQRTVSIQLPFTAAQIVNRDNGQILVKDTDFFEISASYLNFSVYK